jgi:putative ABC transport system permease protein
VVPVARKNLLAEKARLFVAVGGVAFAVFLIVLIQGVYFQLRGAFTSFIDDVPAELWVTQNGAFDVFHSNSTLSEELSEPLSQVPGVAGVQSVIAGQLSFRGEGGDVRSFVVGMRPGLEAAGGGNPFGLDAVPGPGEIVVSDLTLHQGGLKIGDTLSVGERQFVIVGAAGKDIGFRGFSFLDFNDAQSVLAEPGATNYFTVFLKDPSQQDAVIGAIESRLPGVSVFTQKQFAASSREEMSSFNPIIAVLMVIAFIVGATVISLTIYTATVEKAREFGVLKAIGASGPQLYRIVLAQSFAVGVLGFAVGVPLAVVAGNLIGRFVPEFVTLFYWQAILAIFGGVLAMSLIAAHLPVRTVARVDPAVVFRA